MEASTRREHVTVSRPLVRTLDLRPLVIWTLVGLTMILLSIPRVHADAQDVLATARSLYASAAYDEALKALQEVADNAPPSAIREIEQYRFLCLLALGRSSEAKESITAVVTADPLYKLDENTISPRVVDAFRSVRREVLPDVTTAIYSVAKAAFDRKDYRIAEIQLRKVIALGGDPDMPGGKVEDIVRLSKSFLDLTVTALKGPDPAAAPQTAPMNASTNPVSPGGTPTPAANNNPAPTGAAPAGGNTAPQVTRRVEVANQPGSGEIRPPMAIKQAVPPVPPDLSRFGQLRPGEIEVLIDETGKVQTAKVIASIHPVYDAMVMAAAKTWRYDPATADGVPVKYRKRIKITIGESPR
jgi:TonB family protein